MDPTSAWPAAAALVMAVATGWCLVRGFGEPDETGRYASIDGLRGYLAFFVVLHHSAIWFYFLRSGRWQLPPSALYVHFGQASVALFFMITAFLFFGKLIEARRKPLDWSRLFVSRVLRLAPLYLAAVLAMCLIVAALSGWQLHGSLALLFKGLVRWLGFTILGDWDLNGVERTRTILAGVTWSLPYEWFFYCSLPLLALAVGRMAPWPWLFFSGLVMGYVFLSWEPELDRVAPFGGGIAAALLVRSRRFVALARGLAGSLLVLLSVGAVVAFFPTAYEAGALLLLSLAFALIAGGASLFGVLRHPVSLRLGEMAYSIYLLHGMLLFVLFHFIVGEDRARGLSPEVHWLLIIALVPVLLALCLASFRWIEQPAMRSADRVTAWLRGSLRPGRAGRPGEIG